MGAHTIRRASLISGISVLLLAGCAVGPTYDSPTTSFAAEYAHANHKQFAERAPEAEWWQALGDPLVSELIEQALVNNHDVRIAQANMKAARALVREDELSDFPVVTARASASRQRASAATLPGSERTSTFYEAGFDATWEVDFFGRVKSMQASSSAEFEAALADRHAIEVIVAAEVARTYIELRGAQYEFDTVRRNVENQQQTLALVRLRAAAGRGTDLDIARAEAQLQSTRANLPPLKATVARAIHRLSVLTGEEPSALTGTLAKTAPLPKIPGQLAIGTPEDLLRRRADIRSAERRLAAATARIGVATADLFPRVNILGSAGFLATSADDVGRDSSSRTAIGPFLSWAGFDLDRVRARIRAAEAGAEGQLARYEQSVIKALEETENSLVSFSQAVARRSHLQHSARSSERAVELAQHRYAAGADGFLDVLDAERRMLETQQQYVQAETETAVAFVSLYKALGGGWEIAEARTLE